MIARLTEPTQSLLFAVIETAVLDTESGACDAIR